MRPLLVPLIVSLAFAPWPASAQPQDSQSEEVTATPWQAQIYSGHPEVDARKTWRAGATAGTSPTNAAAR